LSSLSRPLLYQVWEKLRVQLRSPPISFGRTPISFDRMLNLLGLLFCDCLFLLW
jgi:hypothetical protein